MIAAVVVLACVLALAVIVIVALVSDRPPRADQHLDDRAEDLLRYGENLERLVAVYSDKLTAIAERKVDEMALLLNAARGDRDRLLTTVLALTDPRAAVTVGRIDEALAVADARVRSGERMTMEQFLTETRDATRDTEFETSEGDPIMPVGMGG